MNKVDIKEFNAAFATIRKIAKKYNYGNILYNEGYLPVMVCNLLKIKYNTTQDPDAFDGLDWVEIKSINTNSKSGKGSFQFHWLSKEKVLKYKKTKYILFVVRFDEDIIEIYKLDTKKIINDLIKIQEISENKRSILEDAGIIKRKNIDGHKSYSIKKIKELGAELIWNKTN